MSWFSDEFQKVVAWLSSLPPAVKASIDKLNSDAGQIVKDDAKIFAQDIVANGLTTASFTKAVGDIMAKTPADAGILIQDVFFILNAEVSYLLTPAAPPVT